MKIKLAILILVMSIGVAMGLTPAERKIALHAQDELHVAITQFDAAQDSAKAADDNLVIANRNLSALAEAIQVAYKREIALAKDNDKMRPVYNQVTSKWGLGAIAFGIGLLFKHLLILGVLVLIVGAALYALSFMFPVIGVTIKLIAGFLHKVAGLIHAIGTHLHLHGQASA